MIRRVFLVVAAAVALILAPSVAMAYNAPGYTCFVTDSTPASGHPIKVHCSKGHSKKQTLTITSTPASIHSRSIQIAGTKSMTVTNVKGAATFNVTLAEAGTYAFVITNAEGVLRSSQTVTVHPATAAAGTTSGGQLSRTGFDALPIALGGGALVLAGAGAVLIARRRKSAQVPA